jgi:hypothetical protein
VSVSYFESLPRHRPYVFDVRKEGFNVDVGCGWVVAPTRETGPHEEVAEDEAGRYDGSRGAYRLSKTELGDQVAVISSLARPREMR